MPSIADVLTRILLNYSMHMPLNLGKKNIRLQQWIAIGAVLLFSIKISAYFLTFSVAILSDALEGIVNIFSGFLGLYSLKLSAQPNDKDHPNGHGKIEFITAGIEGTLIIISGLIIIYQAINSLTYQKVISDLPTGMLLILVASLFNFLFGVLAVRQGRKNNSIALEASGRHLLSDVYTTAGVLVGLVVLKVSGWWWVDSVIGALFALAILLTGYKILRKSIAGIMDKADEVLLDEMVDLLESKRKDNWVDIHNMRIIKYGHALHIDCHLTLPWYYNLQEAHRELDALEHLIHLEFGKQVELFVHLDYCVSSCCSICMLEKCKERKHPFSKQKHWNRKLITENVKHSK